MSLGYDTITTAGTTRDIDLAEANRSLEAMNAEERLLWAQEEFGENLYALTSCGTQASLVLDHINKLGMSCSVVFLDTGFYPPETYRFKDDQLTRYWQDRELYEFGPPPEVVDYVEELRLAYTNKPLYDWAIKGRYFTQAAETLGATAFITGIHRDQTENRSDMEPLGFNKDGNVMVRAFVDWADADVYEHIERNGLPTHPMYPERTFVGDVHFMDEAEKVECGIHIDEQGNIARGMDPKQVELIVARLVELDPEAPVGVQ